MKTKHSIPRYSFTTGCEGKDYWYQVIGDGMTLLEGGYGRSRRDAADSAHAPRFASLKRVPTPRSAAATGRIASLLIQAGFPNRQFLWPRIIFPFNYHRPGTALEIPMSNPNPVSKSFPSAEFRDDSHR